MAQSRKTRFAVSRFTGAALAAAIALFVLPAVASAAYSPELKRYPYLTDVVGNSATINWGTTRAATTGVVKYGQVGAESCTAHTVSASRTSVTVVADLQYQWKARFNVSPNTEYCYRVYLGGSSGIDLLGTDPSPSFRSQLPQGSNEPFSFAVFGNWGQVDDTGTNPQQANIMQHLAASGARFAVTTGDNAYNDGSQRNYGDLVQTGLDTSAVFGPAFWKAPGASMPIFPALGNHGISTANTHFLNWPQTVAVSSSGGRYQNDTYCCLNGTNSATYGSAWYAFDAGSARFYVLLAAWGDTNPGTASDIENDYANHWTPTSPEYRWLQNDLATHPSALKFAFFQYPLYSDNRHKSSDTFLQGKDSLEGLLSRYGVDMAFNGDAHMYQRNVKRDDDSLVSYVTGGGGARLMPIGEDGCSPFDAYGIGWSYSANGGLGRGSACGGATEPSSKDEVFHFLKVSVGDTGVTVTPINSLGQTFDVVTYPTASADADLSLTKSDSSDPALVGRTLTYTLTARNDGPSDAKKVIVTDRLPQGVSFESATASQGDCSEAAGIVTCSLGDLASGEGASVDVAITPQDAGTITNEASIVADDLKDSNTANNASSEDTTIVWGADLSLSKSAAPDPGLEGQELTYTLSIRNDGRDDATGVTVTDNLPAGATLEATTPSQGSCSDADGTVTCELGALASGADASVEIKVTPQRPGRLTNEASVRGDQLDPNADNNRDSVRTLVGPLAELSLTESDSPDPALFGDTVTYNLSVANNGPDEAASVTVTDNLPAGTSYESATPSQGNCSEADGTVTCELGTISNGADASIEITVKPLSAGTFTNSASVASDSSYDVDSANNSATEETTVKPAADLSISKSDSPDPVLVGQTLIYSIAVQNGGPSDATGTTVTDDLPTGVRYQSATPSQGSCSEASGKVTCSLGTLANGSGATVELKVRPDRDGTIANTVRVSSEVVDRNDTNDAAREETTVLPVTDLSITGSDAPDPILAGQTLTYTLSVRNDGPSNASGVTLTDILPPSASYQSAVASQGTCFQIPIGTVTCGLGNIAAGGTATVTIRVTPSNGGTITNQASVNGAETDLSTGNNMASQATVVNTLADLSITQTDSPDPVVVGKTLTYTLSVRNSGPTRAANVRVTDTLPATVTYQSATASQGSCARSGQLVTCNLGTMASGGTATVRIVVLAPQTHGDLTNAASVTSDDPDPNRANNSATATTKVKKK